jgi:hypothetical protein
MDDDASKENPTADFNKIDLSQLQGFSFGTQWAKDKEAPVRRAGRAPTGRRAATTAWAPGVRSRPEGPAGVPQAGGRGPPARRARRGRPGAAQGRRASYAGAPARRAGCYGAQGQRALRQPLLQRGVLPRGHELQRAREDDPLLGADDRALRDRADGPREAGALRRRRLAQARAGGRPEAAPADLRLRPRRPALRGRGRRRGPCPERVPPTSSKAARSRSSRRRATSW